MIPKTYLLTAPDLADGLGQSMLSTDLIRGLQIANSRIAVPAPTQALYGRSGHTAIWLGEPKKPGSKMICAFHAGAIPEWTQLAPDGVVIARGWRAILDRCINVGVASRARLEQIFRVNLEVEGRTADCPKCAREGKRVRANGAAGMCDAHTQAFNNARKADTLRRALKEAI